MSQIEKIGLNTWLIKVCARVQGKDYPIRKQETFNGTKLEAEARKAEIIAEVQSGSNRSLTITTFNEALDLFKEKKGPFFTFAWMQS